MSDVEAEFLGEYLFLEYIFLWIMIKQLLLNLTIVMTFPLILRIYLG